jgi:hypothetical protein
MMDRLQGNAAAHAAFVSGAGEMFAETKNWAFVAAISLSFKRKKAVWASLQGHDAPYPYQLTSITPH